MLKHDFIFPEKGNGPAHSIEDGKWYGNNNYTWNFDISWPVATIDYVNAQTGKNVDQGTGSRVASDAEALKIAKLQKSYIMNKILSYNSDQLIYEVAHDENLIKTMIVGQIEIWQTWGGYQSMYRVLDGNTNNTIGKAAEKYHDNLSIYQNFYTWRIPEGKKGVGY